VDGLPPTFVYEWLAEHESQLQSIATGATFKEITKSAFKRFSFVFPNREILREFAALALPIEREIELLERESHTLARTRDLLLPRLVSGRLDISDIDLGDLLPTEAAA
jgi:type I restriction enzyme S subunit